MASEGGFDYGTVYDMPVYLRRFYMKELEDWKKREAEYAKNGGNTTPPSVPKRPAIAQK